jgi:hypothetical protein
MRLSSPFILPRLFGPWGGSAPQVCSHRRQGAAPTKTIPSFLDLRRCAIPQHHGGTAINTSSTGIEVILFYIIATMASTTSPDPPLAGPSNESAGELPLHQQGSCATCRRRKVKCDKLPFCSNCRRLGLHCEYAPRKRAPRQPRKADGLSTREVELIKRLNKLEGKYLKLKELVSLSLIYVLASRCRETTQWPWTRRWRGHGGEIRTSGRRVRRHKSTKIGIGVGIGWRTRA